MSCFFVHIVNVRSRYQTVSTLLQYYLFVPLIQKDVHLVYLANELASNSIIVFTRTVHDAKRYACKIGFSHIIYARLFAGCPSCFVPWDSQLFHFMDNLVRANA